MTDIINHAAKYYDFFKWHKYYSFHDVKTEIHYDGLCDLCAVLNNNTRESKNDITKFWNNIPSA